MKFTGKISEYFVDRSDKPSRKGFYIYEGCGEEPDYNKSLKLFQQSIEEEEDPLGYFYLGEHSFYGWAVEQDLCKAFEYYTLASKKGNCCAIKRLGDCYLGGFGVERDILLGLKQYLFASEIGNSEAEIKIYNCFKETKREKQKKSQQRSFRSIFKQKAFFKKYNFCKNGDKVLFTGKQVNEIILKLEKRTLKNDCDCSIILGCLYLTGNGCLQNKKRSLAIWKKVAKTGNPTAQRLVGVCYFKGEGVKIDFVNTFKWLKMASDSGSSRSMSSVGYCLQFGVGCENQVSRCIEFYNKSVRSGNYNGYNSLGTCYEDGVIVPRSVQVARELYEISAISGTDHALYNIGLLKLRNNTDVVSAYFWFARSLPLDSELSKDLVREQSLIQFAFSNKASKDVLFRIARTGRSLNHINEKKNIFSLLKFDKQSEYYENYQNLSSYSQDFLNLYRSEKLTDIEIKGIKLHRLILEARLEVKLTEEIVQKMKMFSKKQLRKFFHWVYSGITSDCHLIITILNYLSLGKFSEKTGIKGLRNSFSKLYKSNESADFTLLVEEDEEIIKIPLHKVILFARSGLFRTLFLSVTKQPNSVKDYSTKSIESIELLCKYLYTNNVLLTADHDVEFLNEELEDSPDYYDLNPNSGFLYLLQKDSSNL
ncbi:sel-1-like protein [Anaeramoeba flamelloides]|uniref:Sel-1-like protein n=1 Tax=Anaeramoeba flamelloides TaxID=1746091 RepID=A0AAV7YKC6_9EUKA|nr:sel-1-like protein [Anaeramoeba flamelloides]